jgi:hypothetical protein
MEKIELAMGRLFDQEFVVFHDASCDKIFSGYEVVINRHVSAIGRKLYELIDSFDEIGKWRREVATRRIDARKGNIWSLKKFAEREDGKDDDKETLICLLRLAKIVFEENEKKRLIMERKSK